MQIYDILKADKRSHTFDFVKGICILLIIITHYEWSNAERLRYLFPFWVDMAVPVFMIISGYVYSKSYAKREITSLDDCYQFPFLSEKIIRFSVPFAMAFLCEEAIFTLTDALHITESLSDIHMGSAQTLFAFLQGGQGPGSYYYPVMIQFLFWFPVVHSIIRKYDLRGLALCGAVNFIYELLQRAYDMNETCYRLLLFRYTLAIAFGCYMAIGKRTLKASALLGGMLCGIVYIVVFQYLNISPLITRYWTGTSLFACLYIFPFAYRLPRLQLRCAPLELLGKASYNIFLTQMVYYCEAAFIYPAIPNRFLQLLTNMILCLTAGIIFYFVETPITKLVQARWFRFLSKCTLPD